MVKTKKNNVKNPPPARKPKKQSVASGRLDPAARAYAKLLNDPCYAPLVQPVYDSAGTGMLLRLESDFILGAEATSVGAAILFIPGMLSTTAASTGVAIPTTVVNSDTGAIVWIGSQANQPGSGMAATFGAFRSVAACMQISYVGSELSRAGVVALGQTSYQTALGLTSTAKLRQAAERVVKMPDGVLEVKLSPYRDSTNFGAVGNGVGTEDQPALFASVTGIPASTGVRVRLVNVVEFMPAGNTGIISSVAISPSVSSMSQVLAEMTKRNPQWRYELLTGLGAYAAKAIAWL